MQHADPNRSDRELLAVRQLLERKAGLGKAVNRHRETVLEGEAAVAGDVIRVRVRLEHPLDPDAGLSGGLQVLLDREGGVDDDGEPRLQVADQIRGAAKVVVDELPKQQHVTDRNTVC